MTDPRKGLPPDPTQFNLEKLAEKHCGEEIQASLKKYNCQLLFVQTHMNGMPFDAGMFKIAKIREQGSNQPLVLAEPQQEQ